MSTEKSKIPLKDLLKTLVFFAAFMAVVIYTSSSVSSVVKNKDTSNNASANSTTSPRAVVECPADFLSYQILANDPRSVAVLIGTTTPMFVTDGDFQSTKVITKVETEKSKVACGYVYITAGTKTYGSLQSWENLYIKPEGFGGHVNPENNIGTGDGETHSEYLLPLSKVTYWKNRDDRRKESLLTADWGVLLNVSEKVEFEIGLNTNDKTGFMDKFLFAYKCWDPTTGQQNYDCKVEVTEKK